MARKQSERLPPTVSLGSSLHACNSAAWKQALLSHLRTPTHALPEMGSDREKQLPKPARCCVCSGKEPCCDSGDICSGTAPGSWVPGCWSRGSSRAPGWHWLCRHTRLCPQRRPPEQLRAEIELEGMLLGWQGLAWQEVAWPACSSHRHSEKQCK